MEQLKIPEQSRENRMGTEPVGKVLRSMAIPMMISMMIQALYNVVDSIYVSRLGEEALNAVSLAFPLQNLMIGFGTGTGLGMNALLSRYLGAKKKELADRAANTGVFLFIMSFLVFALIGATLSKPFFRAITRVENVTTQVTETAETAAPGAAEEALAVSAEETPKTDAEKVEQIISYGTDYTTICLTFSFGIFLQFCFERMLQGTGRANLSMITQTTGAVINIILDPILIFGLLGFPRLEVKGAAIATVTGQIVSAVMALIMNLKKNPDVHLSVREILHPVGSMVGEIYKIAFPSILMMSIGSVLNFLLNKILIAFTTTATAVYGAYFKLQSFFFMPIFGLNNAMIPIISYNYGARSKERVIRTFRLSVITGVCIMICGTLIFEIFPRTLLGFFNASPEMLRIGMPALRIIGTHFVFAAVCIISGSVCQAIGNPMHSLITSILRQIVALLPAAWLLSLTGKLDLVWLAFPIAEIVSLVFSLLFLKKTMKKLDAF